MFRQLFSSFVTAGLVVLSLMLISANTTTDEHPRVVEVSACKYFNLDSGPFPIPNEVMDECFPGVDY